MSRGPRSTWAHLVTAVLLVSVLVALVLGPLSLFFSGLWPDAAIALRATLVDTAFINSLLQTLQVALTAAMLATLVALPIAPMIARVTYPPARRGLLLLGVMPLAMPAFVTASILEHALHQLDTAGLTVTLDRELQLILVYALHYYPLILACLILAMQRTHRGQQESALNLGASALTVWRTITLPQMMPPFLLGVLVLVLRVIEDVGTPMIVGVHDMLAPTLLGLHGTSPDAAIPLRAWALIVVALTTLLAIVGWNALLPEPGRRFARPGRRVASAGRAPLHSSLLVVLACVLLILAVAPYAWLVLLATGTWNGAIVPDSLTVESLRQLLGVAQPMIGKTLLYAGVGALLTLTTGAALVIVSLADGWPGTLVRYAVTAIFAIPGVVLAIAYWQLPVPNNLTWLGTDIAWLALACIVALKLLPVISHVVVPSIYRLSRAQKESMQNLGTSRTAMALRFDLPLLATPLMMIFLLGGIGMMLELSIALTLLVPPDTPVAVKVFTRLQSADTVSSGAAWALAMTLFGLMVMWLVARRIYPPRPFTDVSKKVKSHG